MLLDLSQKHVDLASLRRALPGQTEEGYTLSELKHAAEALGHRCRAIILERPDAPPNRPAIAYLANGTHGHCIVVRFLGGMGAARAQILDPPSPPFLVDYSNLVADDGVGSARQLDELCRSHSAYRWICGDVSVNYHTLSEFRTDRGELLDQLLTQSVAVLLAEGLVDLNRVAQDGMRVRASAGAQGSEGGLRRQPQRRRQAPLRVRKRKPAVR